MSNGVLMLNSIGIVSDGGLISVIVSVSTPTNTTR
jgi:hypothetical protein